MPKLNTKRPMNTNQTMQDIFGPPIHTYTRAQAIEDGTLVDVSQIIQPCPFKFPIAMTRAAWTLTIEAGGIWTADEPKDGRERDQDELHASESLTLPEGQDIKGRLHDVFMMMLMKIRANQGASHRVEFSVLVDRNGRGNHTRVELYSVCGPGDTGEPVITIMQLGED